MYYLLYYPNSFFHFLEIDLEGRISCTDLPIPFCFLQDHTSKRERSCLRQWSTLGKGKTTKKEMLC